MFTFQLIFCCIYEWPVRSSLNCEWSNGLKCVSCFMKGSYFMKVSYFMKASYFMKISYFMKASYFVKASYFMKASCFMKASYFMKALGGRLTWDIHHSCFLPEMLAVVSACVCHCSKCHNGWILKSDNRSNFKVNKSKSVKRNTWIAQ